MAGHCCMQFDRIMRQFVTRGFLFSYYYNLALHSLLFTDKDQYDWALLHAVW